MIDNLTIITNIVIIIAVIYFIVSNNKKNEKSEYIVRMTPSVILNSKVFIFSLLYTNENMEDEKMIDLVDKYISHKLGIKLFKNEITVIINSVRYEHRKHLQIRDGLKILIQSNKDILNTITRPQEPEVQNNNNRGVRYE